MGIKLREGFICVGFLEEKCHEIACEFSFDDCQTLQLC